MTDDHDLDARIARLRAASDAIVPRDGFAAAVVAAAGRSRRPPPLVRGWWCVPVAAVVAAAAVLWALTTRPVADPAADDVDAALAFPDLELGP
jgi:hypothetical protein